MRAQRVFSASLSGENSDAAGRIRIPAREIEACRRAKVIEVVLEAHEVVRDPAARRELAQDGDLLLLKRDHHLGAIAIEIEQVRRIGIGRLLMREWNLLPGGVPLAPEDRAPGLVQRRQIAIALLQPAPETAQADLPQDRAVS